MKIMNFNNTIKYTNNCTFKGCNREYYDENLRYSIDTNGHICTFTKMFREDLDWLELAAIIKNKFKDKEKVQVFSLASSDGSEAYSTAIMLMELVPDSKRFFPIKAIDRDEEIINIAKSKRINLTPYELNRIKSCAITDKEYFEDKGKAIDINGNEDKYYPDRIANTSSYSPIDELKDKIIFEKGDILETLKNLKDDGNSIVFCRNVFAYLPVTMHYDICQTLTKNLKKGSLFIIGDYDGAVLFDKKLLNSGFVEIGRNIYQKI